MDVQTLKQADFALNKCGRPIPPAGMTYVPIPAHFPLFQNHPASTLENVPRIIDGDAVFILRAISWIPPVNQLYTRFQWPNGRYYSQVSRLASQIANTGSQRLVLERGIICNPGSSIITTLDDRPTNNGAGAGSVTPVQINFEGIFIYAVQGAQLTPVRTLTAAQAGDLPRYFLTPNENILAPQIALNLATENTPQAATDSGYTICDPNPLGTGFSLASNGPLNTTREVLLSGFEEMLIRRIIFIPSATAGLTGQWMVKVTDLSGYTITNDYIEVQKFSNGPFAHDWPVCGGRKLIFDYIVTDVAGTAGTFSMKTLIEVVRRRK